MKTVLAAIASVLVSAPALSTVYFVDEVPLNPNGTYVANDHTWIWTNEQDEGMLHVHMSYVDYGKPVQNIVGKVTMSGPALLWFRWDEHIMLDWGGEVGTMII